MLLLYELLQNHNVLAFIYAFVSAVGRGFLLNKPQKISHKFVDASVCGFFAVIVTNIAVINGLNVWYSHACSFAFGALGYMVFYDFLNGLLPVLKEYLINKVNKS